MSMTVRRTSLTPRSITRPASGCRMPTLSSPPRSGRAPTLSPSGWTLPRSSGAGRGIPVSTAVGVPKERTSPPCPARRWSCGSIWIRSPSRRPPLSPRRTAWRSEVPVHSTTMNTAGSFASRCPRNLSSPRSRLNRRTIRRSTRVRTRWTRTGAASPSRRKRPASTPSSPTRTTTSTSAIPSTTGSTLARTSSPWRAASGILWNTTPMTWATTSS